LIAVSVIIPTFNRAHTLKRAIDSVLAQTFQSFECIVVDDGSTDETSSLVATYSDPRIVYIKSKNAGVSAARNLGFKNSSGEWIALLDSDDEWLPDKLTKQIEFGQQNPELSLVHGEEIWVRRGKRVNPKKKHAKSGGDIFLRCLELCLISPSAVMIKKELWEEFDGFDEEFVVCEDYDLWLKVTRKYEVGYISDPLIVKYGGHEDQLSSKYRAMDYWRVLSMFRLLQRYPEDLRATSVAKVLKSKGEILIGGYLKHDNLKNLQEVQDMVKEAQYILNQK
jgi:glycosyltransferase involved in cell wall biosynthesis